jgi:hypothetical protein
MQQEIRRPTQLYHIQESRLAALRLFYLPRSSKMWAWSSERYTRASHATGWAVTTTHILVIELRPTYWCLNYDPRKKPIGVCTHCIARPKQRRCSLARVLLDMAGMNPQCGVATTVPFVHMSRRVWYTLLSFSNAVLPVQSLKNRVLDSCYWI